MIYALLGLLNTTLSYFGIDVGNSNISEGEALETVDSLNVSRATFDNYVRE